MIEALKGCIGDCARPLAIIVVAAATGYAIIARGADIIGAAGFVLAAIYGARAAENAVTAAHQAKVDIARAQAPQ